MPNDKNCVCSCDVIPPKSSKNDRYRKHRVGNHGKNPTKISERKIRTRSAERPPSHYTYIDSSSSSMVPEVIYSTIPSNSTNTTVQNSYNYSQPVYSLPSMTSPPPTYDVAISKPRQTTLPPSYEDYLCLSRSHTPPPPWTDTAQTSSENVLRESTAYPYSHQAVRKQRIRPIASRSLSESRVQQQRLCEDGMFVCMEATVIQSALENGVAFCSLM